MRCDFVRQHGRRPAGGPGKIADARRLADQKPGVVVDFHVHDQVAGIELSFNNAFFPAFEFGDLFGGDDHVAEITVQPGNGHAAEQSFADRFLAVALHLEDIPLHFIRFWFLRVWPGVRRRSGFRNGRRRFAVSALGGFGRRNRRFDRLDGVSLCDVWASAGGAILQPAGAVD